MKMPDGRFGTTSIGLLFDMLSRLSAAITLMVCRVGIYK